RSRRATRRPAEPSYPSDKFAGFGCSAREVWPGERSVSGESNGSHKRRSRSRYRPRKIPATFEQDREAPSGPRRIEIACPSDDSVFPTKNSCLPGKTFPERQCAVETARRAVSTTIWLLPRGCAEKYTPEFRARLPAWGSDRTRLLISLAG